MPSTEAAPGLLAYRSIGSGRPVVYLHGGGPGCSSWADFRQVAAELGSGARHLFVDLAQYGASASGPIEGPALDHHASALGRLLEHLAITEVDIVAQSLGGSVALNVAATTPQLVRRIVLTGSQPVPHPEARPELGLLARELYYGGDGPSPAKMRDLLASLEWHDPAAVPEDTVQMRHADSVTPWALAVADGSGRGEPQDLAEKLPDVVAPTLLLWGAHDPFVPPSYAVDLAARMPAADVAVLSRTAHHPQEERPADYARLVAAFLNLRHHPRN